MSDEIQMQSWPTPPTVEEIGCYSDEEARRYLDKSNADKRLRGHPLHPDSHGHPQKKQYMDADAAAYKNLYPDNRTPLEKAMAEGMAEKSREFTAGGSEIYKEA